MTTSRHRHGVVLGASREGGTGWAIAEQLAEAGHLRGMILCLKHQIAAMLPTGGGVIVAVSSLAANMAFSRSPEYWASKAGVTGLVRYAALDDAAHLHGSYVPVDGGMSVA